MTQLKGMLESLRFRGPDGNALYCRDNIALAHARLSIIDLEGGTQPIFNETGSVACVLNGEIYNYRELRSELSVRGHVFRTKSDTEVLVHLYEEEGERGVHKVVGMFSYVIADFDQGRMLVYRDRLGEKPLYFASTPEYFACASEIKALRGLSVIDWALDSVAMAQYLRLGYVPAPRSIHRGISKLEPGSYLRIDGEGVQNVRYWSALPGNYDGRFSREDCLSELDDLMSRVIPQKLVSDVPTGILLSGGLDSTAVVAYCHDSLQEPLRTFSVGFGGSNDELPLARQVAERFGTVHTELHVGPRLVESLKSISLYLDEPFADSSALPTMEVARVAREHVKVVLTGDGGDELFGGYSAYLPQRRYSDNGLLRKTLSAVDRGLSGTGLDVIPGLYGLLGEGGRAQWMRIRAESTCDEIREIVGLPATQMIDPERDPRWPRDPLSEAFEFDLNIYLPDDLLKKVDMMTMLCGLEARAPLLDHRLVEFAMRIPPIEKLRGGRTKGLVRDLLRGQVPDDVVQGRKLGFGAPLVNWLAGPLREFVTDTLASNALIWGALDRDRVQRLLGDARKNFKLDWRAPATIWKFLMLELWLRENAEPKDRVS